MEKKEYIPYTDYCFACGDDNESGIKLKLYDEGNKVKGVVTIDQHLNGYGGMVHGGVICALLDEAMIWSAVVFGKKKTMYVTTEITMKFLAPVPVSREITVTGWITEDRGKVVFCEGEVERGGKPLATARGKFLALGDKKLMEIYPHLRFDRCSKYKDFLGK